MTTKANANERDVLLARHIQKIRKEKGLTQEQLAEHLGISYTHMSYLELGYRIPNLHIMQKIADILQVKVKDLIPY